MLQRGHINNWEVSIGFATNTSMVTRVRASLVIGGAGTRQQRADPEEAVRGAF